MGRKGILLHEVVKSVLSAEHGLLPFVIDPVLLGHNVYRSERVLDELMLCRREGELNTSEGRTG